MAYCHYDIVIVYEMIGHATVYCITYIYTYMIIVVIMITITIIVVVIVIITIIIYVKRTIQCSLNLDPFSLRVCLIDTGFHVSLCCI